jgi:hypothetical protein
MDWVVAVHHALRNDDHEKHTSRPRVALLHCKIPDICLLWYLTTMYCPREATEIHLKRIRLQGARNIQLLMELT